MFKNFGVNKMEKICLLCLQDLNLLKFLARSNLENNLMAWVSVSVVK